MDQSRSELNQNRKDLNQDFHEIVEVINNESVIIFVFWNHCQIKKDDFTAYQTAA